MGRYLFRYTKTSLFRPLHILLMHFLFCFFTCMSFFLFKIIFFAWVIFHVMHVQLHKKVQAGKPVPHKSIITCIFWISFLKRNFIFWHIRNHTNLFTTKTGNIKKASQNRHILEYQSISHNGPWFIVYIVHSFYNCRYISVNLHVKG